MHYLFTDCETGGLDPKINPITEAYFAILNRDLQFIDELHFRLKPKLEDVQSGKLVYEPKALEVTGVNLAELFQSESTITFEEGRKRVIEFFAKNKIEGKKTSFMLAGQNVDFDKDMYLAQLVTPEIWNKYVHKWKKIDTLQMTVMLQDADILPPELGKLESLAEYFGVPLRKAHNAKEDTLMCIDVYAKMRKMLSAKKGDLISGYGESTKDIVSILEAF